LVLLGVLLATTTVSAQEGDALDGDALRALIVGNTVIGPIGARQYDFSYEPGGVVYGSIGVNSDSGAWTIADDGLFCQQWAQHFDGERRCYRWVPAPRNRYRMLNVDAFRTREIPVWRIEPGLQ
jgi:hypothetical protein